MTAPTSSSVPSTLTVVPSGSAREYLDTMAACKATSMLSSFAYPAPIQLPRTAELIVRHRAVPARIAISCTVNPGLSSRISATAAGASSVWPRQAYAEARSTQTCQNILPVPIDLRHHSIVAASRPR